ncbi:MAG: glutamate racemase, partial [Thermomicrobiales bacterium]
MSVDDRQVEDGQRRPPAAVGLFDSGWGGLSIAQAIRAELPGVDTVYLGDHAWCPYGGRDSATIVARSLALSRWLAGRGVAMVVIACNTASALALDAIKKAVKIPVVGVIEPGAERAAVATLHRTVLV